MPGRARKSLSYKHHLEQDRGGGRGGTMGYTPLVVLDAQNDEQFITCEKLTIIRENTQSVTVTKTTVIGTGCIAP